LVKQIALGNTGVELATYLLARELPLTAEEYLEALAFLQIEDRWRDEARKEIAKIAQETKLSYLQKRNPPLRVVNFLLEQALLNNDLQLIAAVILNLHLPESLLMRVAATGSTEALELLLENQLKLIAFPEIIAVMEANPGLNPFTAGKLKEIREFYLHETPAAPIAEEVLQEIDPLAVHEAPVEGDEPDSAEAPASGFVQAATTLQRINSMSISERIKMALTGSKTERMILIKDPNKMVSISVVESPKITVDEIMLLIRNRSIPGEIITKIANNREWTKNYPVVLGLVENPKTPVNRALEFVKKLYIRDLRSVAHDKNISPVIRGLALNLFRSKEVGKK